ncbi:MAG TPA: hypothetical protein VK440_05105 [Burkholderiales bacterium]|nr:hypothetical protein [Burkholderiales bacterium]
MVKAFFIVMAMLISTLALADQAQPQTGQKGSQPQNFQEHKQHMLDRMDKRIAALQQARSCVSQAQDRDAVKQCFPKHEGHREHGHDRGD